MQNNQIAVMRFSAIGDIAATIPFIRQMETPPCIITSPTGKALLEDEFSDFILLRDKSSRSQFRLLREIHQRGFSDIIDLQGNDRCRFLGKCIRAFSKTNIHNGCLQRDHYLPVSKLAAQIWDAAASNTTFTPKPRNYIVLNTGSSAKWTAKRPPTWKWKEFAEILNERYALPFKMTGSTDEVDYINSITNELPGDAQVLAGTTSLIELKQLLKNAFLTVSTDSAAMHLSAIGKTPTIGIFGSTTKESMPKWPWCVGLYDRTYYPTGNLPKCTSNIDKYYDHIDLEEGIKVLGEFLRAE